MNVDKLKQLAMNDNGFVFDPSSGHSYSTNETGLVILKMISSAVDKDKIRKTILDEYEIVEDNFNSDYDHYLLMLEAFGLIEL
jgi:hypothetical protein